MSNLNIFNERQLWYFSSLKEHPHAKFGAIWLKLKIHPQTLQPPGYNPYDLRIRWIEAKKKPAKTPVVVSKWF